MFKKPAFSTDHGRGVVLAATGTLTISFDAVLVRLADTSEWNVVFWRGLFIFVSLLLYQFVRRSPGRRLPSTRQGRFAALCITLLYGVTMTLFVVSVSNTIVANTVVILSSAPFFAALLSWLFLRERIAWHTAVAIAAAFAGVLIIFGGALGSGGLLGNICAVITALSVGTVLTILRRFPDIDRITVICCSGLVAAIVAWPMAEPWSLALSSYLFLAIMGLVQVPLAMVLVASSTRYISSPEAALFFLIESVTAPIWVWLAVGEVPPSLTFVGATVVLLTVALHSWYGLHAAKQSDP